MQDRDGDVDAVADALDEAQALLGLGPGLGGMGEDEERRGLEAQPADPVHCLVDLLVADVLVNDLAAHPLRAGLDAEGDVLHPRLAHQRQQVVVENVDAHLGDEADAQLLADEQAAEFLGAPAAVVEGVIEEPQHLGAEAVAVPADLVQGALRRVAAHVAAPVVGRGAEVAVEGAAARGDDVRRPQQLVAHRPAEVVLPHGDEVLAGEGERVDVLDHRPRAGEARPAVAAVDDAGDALELSGFAAGLAPGGDVQDGALALAHDGQVDGRDVGHHVQPGHGGVRPADDHGLAGKGVLDVRGQREYLEAVLGGDRHAHQVGVVGGDLAQDVAGL